MKQTWKHADSDIKEQLRLMLWTTVPILLITLGIIKLYLD